MRDTLRLQPRGLATPAHGARRTRGRAGRDRGRRSRGRGDEAARHPGLPVARARRRRQRLLRGSAGGAAAALSRRRRDARCSRSRSAVERPGCCGAAPRPGWLQVLAGGAGIAGCATAVTAGMEPPGAPVVGWPLLWAVPLAPLRIFGEPTIDAAWTAGVALSLACVAIATVACGLLGRWASGSDAVGIGAAALFTAWPLVVGTLAGRQAWRTAHGSRTPACTSTRSRSRRRSS